MQDPLQYCAMLQRCGKLPVHGLPYSSASDAAELLGGVLHGELALSRTTAISGGSSLEEACSRLCRTRRPRHADQAYVSMPVVSMSPAKAMICAPPSTGSFERAARPLGMSWY